MKTKSTSEKVIGNQNAELGEDMFIAHCPSGKFTYSRHRLNSISSELGQAGVHRVTMQCRVCLAKGEVTHDYNVLSGIF